MVGRHIGGWGGGNQMSHAILLHIPCVCVCVCARARVCVQIWVRLKNRAKTQKLPESFTTKQ